MGMRHPARPCMDKRITAADKQCKKDQKWGAQAVVSGFGRGPMTPSCVNRRNTCGPDRRSAADIASDPYDKKHGPYVQEAEVVKPTLSPQEKLQQEIAQELTRVAERLRTESREARTNACLSTPGGYCYPDNADLRGRPHPCNACDVDIGHGSGFFDEDANRCDAARMRGELCVKKVGGSAAFDRVVACQKRTKTPCK